MAEINNFFFRYILKLICFREVIQGRQLKLIRGNLGNHSRKIIQRESIEIVVLFCAQFNKPLYRYCVVDTVPCKVQAQ